MWPEGWKIKTHKVGGGDIPLTYIRYYTYSFYKSVWHRFKRVRATVVLPFDTRLKDGVKEKWVIDSALGSAPFLIRGENVMDWAQENIKEGFASFEFCIDTSFEHLMESGKAEKELTARFSDPSMAVLFKLTFGGR